MKLIIIFILICLLLFIKNYNNNLEKFTNINIDNDINNIIKNIFKSNFEGFNRVSHKIDNIQQNMNVNLTNNFTNTGILKLNGPATDNNHVKVSKDVTFVNRNNKDYIFDIYPRYFILMWANNDYIPNGWVKCNGKTYRFDKNTNNNITEVTNEIRDYDKYIYVSTPNFDNVIPHAIPINNQSSSDFISIINSLYKVKYNELKYIYQSNIPEHYHRIATKLTPELGIGENFVGFDYEKVLASPDRYINNGGMGGKQTYDCTGKFDFYTKSCPHDFNWWNENRAIPEIKRRRPDIVASPTLENIALSMGIAYTNYKNETKKTELSEKRNKMWYGSGSAGYGRPHKIADFMTDIKNHSYTPITLMPPYCALNYIMKLT